VALGCKRCGMASGAPNRTGRRLPLGQRIQTMAAGESTGSEQCTISSVT
jgi:hypothetical protein